MRSGRLRPLSMSRRVAEIDVAEPESAAERTTRRSSKERDIRRTSLDEDSLVELVMEQARPDPVEQGRPPRRPGADQRARYLPPSRGDLRRDARRR